MKFFFTLVITLCLHFHFSVSAQTNVSPIKPSSERTCQPVTDYSMIKKGATRCIISVGTLRLDSKNGQVISGPNALTSSSNLTTCRGTAAEIRNLSDHAGGYGKATAIEKDIIIYHTSLNNTSFKITI